MIARYRMHSCICMFVPPRVIENLARTGNAHARLTAVRDEQARASRAAQGINVAALSASMAAVMRPPAGTSGREIFDCKNTWSQQVKLVRGEGDPVTKDACTNDAYDIAGKVRRFFKDCLGRNSIDNLGLNQIHNVHYGSKYMNAFWDGIQMTYGDGDGTMFAEFTKDADVIAHELSHGVTQYTAALQYYSQSGALNEHFSDVFGSAIQQFVEGKTAGDADWLIGDGIMGPTLYGEALRSMKAPGTAYDNPLMGKDPQPDHMSNYYADPPDNRGVHINSGVPNKAFYLVAMDVGTDKAALIWYTALQKLWSTAVFSDLVKVVTESARLLAQSGQVRQGATQSVRAAFKAVGL